MPDDNDTFLLSANAEAGPTLRDISDLVAEHRKLTGNQPYEGTLLENIEVYSEFTQRSGVILPTLLVRLPERLPGYIVTMQLLNVRSSEKRYSQLVTAAAEYLASFAMTEYSPEQFPADLSNISDYEYRNLAAHLVNGGRSTDLHRLLSQEDDGKPLWHFVRERRGELSGFLADVELAWRSAEQPDNAAKICIPEQLALCANYCLTVSSAQSVLREMSPQNLAAYLSTGFWSFERVLDYVKLQNQDIQKAYSIAAIAPHIADNDLSLLFALARSLDDCSAPIALAAISGRLDPPEQADAIEHVSRTAWLVPDLDSQRDVFRSMKDLFEERWLIEQHSLASGLDQLRRLTMLAYASSGENRTAIIKKIRTCYREARDSSHPHNDLLACMLPFLAPCDMLQCAYWIISDDKSGARLSFKERILCRLPFWGPLWAWRQSFEMLTHNPTKSSHASVAALQLIRESCGKYAVSTLNDRLKDSRRYHFDSDGLDLLTMNLTLDGQRQVASWLAQRIDSANGIGSDTSEVCRTIENIAAVLSGEERKKIHNALQTMSGRYHNADERPDWVFAMAAMSRYASSEKERDALIEFAFESASRNTSHAAQVVAAGFVPFRNDLLAKAYSLACLHTDGEYWLRATCRSIPLLRRNTKRLLIREQLYNLKRIPANIGDLCAFIKTIAPELTSPYIRLATHSVTEIFWDALNGGFRKESLECIARRCNVEQLAELFELCQPPHSNWPYAIWQMVTTVAVRLADLGEMENAFSLAENIEDESERLFCRVALFMRLPFEERQAIVTDVLAANDLRALDFICSTWESWNGLISADALLEYVCGQADTGEKDSILAKLSRRVSVEKVADALKQIDDLNELPRFALSAIEVLVNSGYGSTANEFIEALGREEDRLRAYSRLIAKISENERPAHCARAMECCRGLIAENRLWALDAAADFCRALPEQLRDAFVNSLLAECERVSDEIYWLAVYHLSDVVPNAKKLFSGAIRLPDEGVYVDTNPANALAHHLGPMAPDECCRFVVATLREISDLPRSTTITSVAILGKLLSTNGMTDCTEALYLTSAKVIQLWPFSVRD